MCKCNIWVPVRILLCIPSARSLVSVHECKCMCFCIGLECSLGQIKCSLRSLTGFCVCSGPAIARFVALSRHQKAVCPWLKSTNKGPASNRKCLCWGELCILWTCSNVTNHMDHVQYIYPHQSLSPPFLFSPPPFLHVQPFRSPSSITSLTLPSFAIYKRSVSIRLYHFHHGEFRSHPSSAPSGGRVHSAAKRVGAYWVGWMEIGERCVHAQRSVV